MRRKTRRRTIKQRGEARFEGQTQADVFESMEKALDALPGVSKVTRKYVRPARDGALWGGYLFWTRTIRVPPKP